MIVLPDANVLIALLVADHVHHDAADMWFAGVDGKVATCPNTEGALVRMLLRVGQPPETAKAILRALASDPRHVFWPDTVSYRDVPLAGVVGHRQVTDAYLAHLARTHTSRLATFDQGLAALHPDVTDLITTK